MDGRMPCVKIVITKGRDCVSDEWINRQKHHSSMCVCADVKKVFRHHTKKAVSVKIVGLLQSKKSKKR